MNELIKNVAVLYGITVEQMFSKCQKREYSDARAMLAFVLWTFRCDSNKISKIVGRHRTTVNNMVLRTVNFIKFDKNARKISEILLERFGGVDFFNKFTMK